MVEIQIQRRLFCQDTWTRGNFVYKHCYFNLFSSNRSFSQSLVKYKLVAETENSFSFFRHAYSKLSSRWIIKTGQVRILSSGVDELFNLGELSAPRRRKIWYSSAQAACNFQDYRLWHCFLRGSYWSLAVGDELPYSLLKANICKVTRAPQAAEKLARIIKINSSVLYLRAPSQL